MCKSEVHWPGRRRHDNHKPDLIVIELLHGRLGFLFGVEGDEGIAPVVPVEVHHHPHLIHLTKLRKEGEGEGERERERARPIDRQGSVESV